MPSSLLVGGDARAIAFRDGREVSLREFRRDIAAIARRLPARGSMIDLCEDRYCFLAAYAAAASVGHTVLLPSSRADRIVAEVSEAHADSYPIDDAAVDAALANVGSGASRANPALSVSAAHVVMIGFTSGSTGEPKAFPKTWGSVSGSNECNAEAIRAVLGGDSGVPTPSIVATVPAQHMYGMELSVLLPLAGGMAVHAGRPLFPADIAAALGQVPEPRILVSTPVHLRAIVDSSQTFPAVAVVISATAPLDAALARTVEERLGATLLEMFGSTETCVFATRRTAHEAEWRLYPGVQLSPTLDGTLVNAPWFAQPTLLQDIVELRPPDRFIVRGRNADMIEVAGKRASLADLTRRLLAIEGVREAAVFQPETKQVGAIRRVAALVVAPDLSAREVLERLAPSVDPAFLPRPLLVVKALPRNEVGKLPREALLKALRAGR